MGTSGGERSRPDLTCGDSKRWIPGCGFQAVVVAEQETTHRVISPRRQDDSVSGSRRTQCQDRVLNARSVDSSEREAHSTAVPVRNVFWNTASV